VSAFTLTAQVSRAVAAYHRLAAAVFRLFIHLKKTKKKERKKNGTINSNEEKGEERLLEPHPTGTGTAEDGIVHFFSNSLSVVVVAAAAAAVV
jgi:hypothetical protein